MAGKPVLIGVLATPVLRTSLPFDVAKLLQFLPEALYRTQR
jgi:hypothetical protein